MENKELELLEDAPMVEETPKETPKKRTTKKEEPPKPEKSKRKISMKEYMIGKRIRRETQAAIRIKLGNDLFHTREQWDEIVKNHTNE